MYIDSLSKERWSDIFPNFLILKRSSVRHCYDIQTIILFKLKPYIRNSVCFYLESVYCWCEFCCGDFRQVIIWQYCFRHQCAICHMCIVEIKHVISIIMRISGAKSSFSNCTTSYMQPRKNAWLKFLTLRSQEMPLTFINSPGTLGII